VSRYRPREIFDPGSLGADRVVKRERTIKHAPVICFRSSILQSAAASTVADIIPQCGEPLT
jgi:hypothetical protein